MRASSLCLIDNECRSENFPELLRRVTRTQVAMPHAGAHYTGVRGGADQIAIKGADDPGAGRSVHGRLTGQVTTVSVETLRICEALPLLE